MSDHAEKRAPDAAFAKAARVDARRYDEMYRRSVEDPETFWREEAQRLDWMKPFSKVREASFDYGNVEISWFGDGTLNVAQNCVDRHLKDHGDDTAIIWVPDDDDGSDQHINYAQLSSHVNKFANVLKKMGVERGDRVVIYLPMIPQAAYAMLACARIGAIHSVVFAGFSPDALASRIEDCGAKVVITADGGPRGGKLTALKKNTDAAFDKLDTDAKMLVVKRAGNEIAWTEGRDHWLHEMEEQVDDDCPPEEMNAEDPLFILYTSGSTGAPKGVVHSQAGYLLHTAMSFELVFDYRPGDVYWCTADVGWVTGHSYIVYGPLANGATTLMFEGVPTWPDAGRAWKICEDHGVAQFYTAPTAIRALMARGDQFVERHDLSSLRVLGTVGEPINPEAWAWYDRVVGKGRCPIVDTWWQTETGGHMLTPLPGATTTKPGSATMPFFGVRPLVLDPQSGEVLEGNGVEGVLAIAESWPGQMRTVWGDHERFMNTYFQQYEGVYFSGDGCRRDEDGYYWITGRVDDVINVSGHRMGTAEIESALVSHEAVSEAAVVGVPHDVKGQGIYCYVSLMDGREPTDELKKELRDWVAQEIGPIAKPEHIQWTPSLPKTRSGKIMRRILRKVAANEHDQLGDTSTLAEPEVVDTLIAERQNV
ncbi:acetate--CoA ligase [Palleronia sp. LCG004]|uniref:acetate--CoA ligase n=1 Tax=Palleronia sp. LCG004 TaxID=3079304 RepID=UPI0029425FE8|nr:acetate--CoA ligase [Palleronia sp. LCG004]WOI55273.1 acetate--CoA ligase [Palleronia sp. LCG004]